MAPSQPAPKGSSSGAVERKRPHVRMGVRHRAERSNELVAKLSLVVLKQALERGVGQLPVRRAAHDELLIRRSA